MICLMVFLGWSNTGDQMNPAVAIIPARGGSKGVADKNLREVGGISLVERAIITAKDTSQINTVIVSTDSENIAAQAESAGAEIVYRPNDLAGDGASSESAIIHALESWYESRGLLPDITLFMQCTSPFTSSKDIGRAIEMVSSDRADVAFSVTLWHGFLWRQGDSGLEPINHPGDYRPRRQDLDKVVKETGGFYAMNTQGFLNARYRFFGHVEGIRIESRLSLDIDTEDDLELANVLVAQL